MEETRTLAKHFIWAHGVLFGILSVAACFLSSTPLPWMAGYLLGGGVDIASFLLLKRTLEKIATSDLSPEQAKRYASGRYFLRFGLSFLVLVLGLLTGYPNVFAVIIGLVLVRMLVLYSSHFVASACYTCIFKERRREDG